MSARERTGIQTTELAVTGTFGVAIMALAFCVVDTWQQAAIVLGAQLGLALVAVGYNLARAIVKELRIS